MVWLRAGTAALGFLVTLLTLRDARQRRREDVEGDVDWTGVLGFAILVVTTSVRSLQRLHDPFAWDALSYPVAYLLGSVSLARRFEIPGVRRVVHPKDLPER